MTNSPAKKTAATAAAIAAIVTHGGADGLTGRAVEDATKGEHPRKLIRESLKATVAAGIIEASRGANSTLHRVAQPCRECGYPLADDHDGVHPECALADALGPVPVLPGALCHGQHHLFDATVAQPRSTIGALHLARTMALRLCAQCPALRDCRTWLDGETPEARPPGVVAGQINS